MRSSRVRFAALGLGALCCFAFIGCRGNEGDSSPDAVRLYAAEMVQWWGEVNAGDGTEFAWLDYERLGGYGLGLEGWTPLPKASPPASLLQVHEGLMAALVPAILAQRASAIEGYYVGLAAAYCRQPTDAATRFSWDEASTRRVSASQPCTADKEWAGNVKGRDLRLTGDDVADYSVHCIPRLDEFGSKFSVRTVALSAFCDIQSASERSFASAARSWAKALAQACGLDWERFPSFAVMAVAAQCR